MSCYLAFKKMGAIILLIDVSNYAYFNFKYYEIFIHDFSFL